MPRRPPRWQGAAVRIPRVPGSRGMREWKIYADETSFKHNKGFGHELESCYWDVAL